MSRINKWILGAFLFGLVALCIQDLASYVRGDLIDGIPSIFVSLPRGGYEIGYFLGRLIALPLIVVIGWGIFRGVRRFIRMVRR